MLEFKLIQLSPTAFCSFGRMLCYLSYVTLCMYVFTFVHPLSPSRKVDQS